MKAATAAAQPRTAGEAMKAATAAAQPRTAGGAMKAAMAAVQPKRLQSVGSQRGQWFDAWVAMARPRKEKEPATDAATGEPDEYVTLSMSELKKDSSAATVALGLVFGYLALGVAFYSQNTDWSVLECFYFVVVTLSSVGFGDLTPQTDAMRLFTGAYILVGVGILGTALGEVVSSLLDADDSTAAGRLIKWLSGAGEEKDEDGDVTVSASLVPTLLTVAGTIALGSAAFFCFDGDLSPIQALYYSIVTVTTVGYGDYTPRDDVARAFTSLYALFGTVLLARALGAIADIPLARRRALQQQLVLEP